MCLDEKLSFFIDNIQCLKWVPKASRKNLARALIDVLNKVIAAPSELANWCSHYILARNYLNLTSGELYDWPPLTKRWLILATELYKSSRKNNPPRQAKRSKQLNSEITPVNCSTREIKEANLFFPSGSAGGPDRISPQVLKDLVNVKREVGTYLLSSLTAFTNVVVSGHVPEKVHLFFFGASLFALGKKNGGVRPIAAGNVFRRLASKYEGRRYYSDWKSSFGSLRFGFGTPKALRSLSTLRGVL